MAHSADASPESSTHSSPRNSVISSAFYDDSADRVFRKVPSAYSYRNYFAFLQFIVLFLSLTGRQYMGGTPIVCYTLVPLFHRCICLFVYHVHANAV